uniref:Transferrin-like domain-containing protein n=1 Tax=Globodera pallida TaxID=36090 RepID=A0A183CMS7_GLOPA
MFSKLTTVDRFCGEFRLLCHPEKRNDFVSESLLLLLGKLLNMFLVLDALKDMKASTKNDLSTFRRASQFASHNSHTLSLFLANQNSIKQLLRKEIQKMDGHEELLADLINISSHFYENKMYISPDQRHAHIKVIAFCLYLMDLEVYTRLDQKKRISIQKLDKIFNSIEVVPLFGGMNILPFSFVKQCRNARQCGPNGQCKCYDSAKWPLSNNESERCHVDIVQRLPHIREQHDDFVTNLSRIRNEISVYNRVGPSNDGENREMANLVLSGLQLLCGWTCDVVETVAWKLLNPTNQRRNADCPDNAETYELATKYNYTGHEKAAIIEEAVQRGYEAAMDELQTVGIDATYARFDMCMPPHFVRADGPSYTAAVVAAILSLFMQRRVRADSAVR